jgi:hypothetical protein
VRKTRLKRSITLQPSAGRIALCEVTQLPAMTLRKQAGRLNLKLFGRYMMMNDAVANSIGCVVAGKVGTGFDNEMLQRLGRKLARLETPNSPFSDDCVLQRGVHWVRPPLKSASPSGRRTINCAIPASSACGKINDRRRSRGKPNVRSWRASASIATHRGLLRVRHGAPPQRPRPRRLPRPPA